MTVKTRTFHYHEKGNHDETWYRLAKDDEAGDVYIEHAWACGPDVDDVRIELATFLSTDRSSAREKLVKLIGSLIDEKSDKP